MNWSSAESPSACWVSDAPQAADTVTCESTGGLSCSRHMVASGVMYVSAYVNGEQQQQAIQVTVLPPTKCSERSDVSPYLPELANPVMDQAMKQLWKDSKYSPNPKDISRREVGGWIIKDANNNYSFQPFQYGPSASNSQCWTDTPLPIPAGAVATIHTHPFSVGDSYEACNSNDSYYKKLDGTWGKYPGGASGGGAPNQRGDYGDLEYIRDSIPQPNGVPLNLKGFILDNDGITAYDLSDLDNGPAPGQPRIRGKRYPRCSYP